MIGYINCKKLSEKGIIVAIPLKKEFIILIDTIQGYKFPRSKTIYEYLEEGVFAILRPKDFEYQHTINLDTKELIQCLKNAKSLDLWTDYMSENSINNLSKIVNNEQEYF